MAMIPVYYNFDRRGALFACKLSKKKFEKICAMETAFKDVKKTGYWRWDHEQAGIDRERMNMTIQYSIRHEDKLLTYELKRSDRKTIEISVHPDKSVIVRAPRRVSGKELDKVLQKRANWIVKKLQYFERYEPRNNIKNYIDGEEHPYLGRQYRLKISSGPVNEVKLSEDTFLITCKEKPYPEKVKEVLEHWYRNKAEETFEKYIKKWWPYFDKKGFSSPRLRIKKMKTRWGSLSKKGNLSLNLELIKAPAECIEYVVIHELCHLEHHNHGPDFYSLLQELMPDWKERKYELKSALA